MDAAIKDFEEAGNLQPNADVIDYRLYLIYRHKGDPIMTAKYYKSWQEKARKGRNDLASLVEPTTELAPKSKAEPGFQPDTDVDPLEAAKKELEKELDAPL